MRSPRRSAATGVVVFEQSGGEPAQRSDVVGPGFGDPGVEMLALALAQHPAEVADGELSSGLGCGCATASAAGRSDKHLRWARTTRSTATVRLWSRWNRCDLDRVRGAGSSAGVAARVVSTDHLRAGVGAQPLGEGVGEPVGQHIDRLAGVHVHQDRGVGCPRRVAKSSTPSTATAAGAGSGSARISRGRLIRDTDPVRWRAMRSPGRPPSASAIRSNTLRELRCQVCGSRGTVRVFVCEW
jgi:hypothetical protein